MESTMQTEIKDLRESNLLLFPSVSASSPEGPDLIPWVLQERSVSLTVPQLGKLGALPFPRGRRPCFALGSPTWGWWWCWHGQPAPPGVQAGCPHSTGTSRHVVFCSGGRWNLSGKLDSPGTLVCRWPLVWVFWGAPSWRLRRVEPLTGPCWFHSPHYPLHRWARLLLSPWANGAGPPGSPEALLLVEGGWLLLLEGNKIEGRLWHSTLLILTCALILQSSVRGSVVDTEVQALFGFFHIVFAILFSNLNFYLYFKISSSIS